MHIVQPEAILRHIRRAVGPRPPWRTVFSDAALADVLLLAMSANLEDAGVPDAEQRYGEFSALDAATGAVTDVVFLSLPLAVGAALVELLDRIGYERADFIPSLIFMSDDPGQLRRILARSATGDLQPCDPAAN